MQTKDIILEEMPPPPTQLSCNAESLLPCFVSHSGVILHQAQCKAQVTTDFLLRNSFLRLQIRLNSERNNGIQESGEGTLPGNK